jgi:hypothetical protein
MRLNRPANPETGTTAVRPGVKIDHATAHWPTKHFTGKALYDAGLPGALR